MACINGTASRTTLRQNIDLRTGTGMGKSESEEYLIIRWATATATAITGGISSCVCDYSTNQTKICVEAYSRMSILSKFGCSSESYGKFASILSGVC